MFPGGFPNIPKAYPSSKIHRAVALSHEGLTNTQIAKKLKISVRTIQNWQKGATWAKEAIRLKEADAKAFAEITTDPLEQSPVFTAKYQLELLEARDGLKKHAKAQVTLAHALTQTAGEALVDLRNRGVDATELTAKYQGLLQYADKGDRLARGAMDIYTKIYAIEEVLGMMADGQNSKA